MREKPYLRLVPLEEEEEPAEIGVEFPAKDLAVISAALCAAALLAGCGSSIGSKDGGYYATEAAAQESYANYDSAAGSVDSGLVPPVQGAASRKTGARCTPLQK